MRAHQDMAPCDATDVGDGLDEVAITQLGRGTGQSRQPSPRARSLTVEYVSVPSEPSTTQMRPTTASSPTKWGAAETVPSDVWSRIQAARRADRATPQPIEHLAEDRHHVFPLMSGKQGGQQHLARQQTRRSAAAPLSNLVA